MYVLAIKHVSLLRWEIFITSEPVETFLKRNNNAHYCIFACMANTYFVVFFSESSPDKWGNPNGIKCAKETLPVLNYTQPFDLNHDMRTYDLVASTAKSMKKVPVTLIDITRMSDYRKDAHTSIYTLRQGHLLTPKQKADPQKFADCIHWCLPGVPDVWNQVLYTRIFSKLLPSPPTPTLSLPPQ
jgi:hypothetical protein